MKTITDRRWFDFARKVHVESAIVSKSNEELVEEYLSWKGSYTSSAVRTYRIWIERFQRYANKTPEKMNIADFTSFAEQVKQSYAPKAVELALNVVHNYLRFFSEQGRLRIPMYLVRVPKAVARSHRTIQESEYRQMMHHMRNKALNKARLRDSAIVMLLHDTGMRIGELLSLRIGDVEPSDSSAVIVSEKSKVLRRVFWSDESDALIRKLIAGRQRDRAESQDVLFAPALGYGKAALNSRSVQRMIKRVAKGAGIESSVVPHSFRHAYIHRLAHVGTPDAVIAQMVGHSTPLTISHYTKLSRPEMQNIAKKRFAVLA